MIVCFCICKTPRICYDGEVYGRNENHVAAPFEYFHHVNEVLSLSCPRRSRLKIHHLTNSNNFFTALRFLSHDVAVFVRLVYSDRFFFWYSKEKYNFLFAFLLRAEIWRDTQVEGQNKVVKNLFFPAVDQEPMWLRNMKLRTRLLLYEWILELSLVLP